MSGSNNLENAAVSSIVEGVDEIWIRMIAYFFETDEAAKVKKGFPSQNNTHT